MCDILASAKCYKRYDFIWDFLELKTDELSEICDGSLFPVLGALPGHMTDGCDSSERESVYSIQVSFCPKTVWHLVCNDVCKIAAYYCIYFTFAAETEELK